MRTTHRVREAADQRIDDDTGFACVSAYHMRCRRPPAFRAAIRRRTQVIPATQAQPQPPPTLQSTTRTEHPVRRGEGEDARHIPERQRTFEFGWKRAVDVESS